MELSAIAIRNSIPFRRDAELEKRFFEIAAKYSHEDFVRFARMLAEVANELDENGPSDVLGEVYMSLELGNKWKGQFFTPYPVSKFMAEITFPGTAAEEVEAKGFVTVSEPACGSGGMVIAAAHVLKEREVNYQTSMHATCTDVDLKCVHMAYVQLSLLGIPATVVHGDTLKLEAWSFWNTPFHELFGWGRKLS